MRPARLLIFLALAIPLFAAAAIYAVGACRTCARR